MTSYSESGLCVTSAWWPYYQNKTPATSSFEVAHYNRLYYVSYCK